ncbi:MULTISPECIES: hypothetical protein [Roseiflexus]|jgi:hypothetical protein|uniref:Uncharacterized protein n=1 Tax=Roseiflexus castenholzii (strain DSM 13941 / HLO8) TaxID=383372 RepID=A7NS42_ROSCS|nr:MULTISPECIES: hypothetical protein [Roseiflexus]ABU60388.1 conserved hypothetical protein [Roseiflexus castenholzii DSM 13941]GIV98770.1 MAG: hypothetical protein KatS3mg058_0174 [Roseiflexus sp.]
MIAFFLASFALLTALLTLARLHLGIANEDGSHDPAAPFVIRDPTLAQAIYGRLSVAAPRAYYTFSVPAMIGVRAMLLIPEKEHQSGFRAHMVLSGPGFPTDGLAPDMHLSPLTIAGRAYRLVQSYVPPLPSAGVYRIEVRHEAGSGVYCLCVGARESGHADAAMRARIERMLDGESR